MAGHFGRFFGCGQLRSTLLDQLFKVMAVPIQLLTDTFFLGDVLLHRQVMGGRAIRLANRRDHGMLIINLAILAPVDQLA